MTEKMTIHRALSDLKTLDARIQKGIAELQPVALAQLGKTELVNGRYPRTEFEANAKANYQSINDLFARKDKIKQAIVISNAKTVINVGSQTMTVADAITKKDALKLKENLLGALKSARNMALKTKENSDTQLEANINALMQSAMTRDNKLTGDEYEQIAKPFRKANEMTLIDPLGIEKEIASLEDEILKFKTEVDAVLSESNAITYIEI